MRSSSYLLAVLFCGLNMLPANAADKPEDYLADGKLKERVEVQELQGGFAGFTGKYYAIEQDGSWSTGQVLPRMMKRETAQGKLNAEQLTELAKSLSSNDLASLPNHGKPVTNPQVTAILYGKTRSELQPERGKANDKEDQAIRTRYAKIVESVKALCK